LVDPVLPPLLPPFWRDPVLPVLDRGRLTLSILTWATKNNGLSMYIRQFKVLTDGGVVPDVLLVDGFCAALANSRGVANKADQDNEFGEHVPFVC
jgi:hypothetical protein